MGEVAESGGGTRWEGGEGPMTTSPRTIVLSAEPTSLDEFGFATIVLRADGDEKGTPSDLRVAIGEKSFQFPASVERISRSSSRDDFPSTVGVYVSDQNPRICYIFGLWSVLAVDVHSGIASECLRLFRGSEDDQGFYQEISIHEIENGFAVIYEGGIAMMAYDGRCKWHTKLMWDDLLMRIEETSVFYWSEHREGSEDFKIRLEDGALLEI